jgi:hypothetical protein
LQSLLMICAQYALLYVCIRYAPQEEERALEL